jgi:tetratricopeptide (TPR) repeat protein
METFLHDKMLPEALSMAEKRLSRLPLDVDARVFINFILIEMGRIDESRNILNGLEKDITALSFVFLQTANAYQKKGLNQDAVFCYQKFLSLNPLSEYFQEVTKKVALLQQEDQLTDEDEIGGADMPKPEFYTLTLADLYIKQGHLKLAADVLTEIIRREPVNGQARAKLDTVKAAIALQSSYGGTVPATNNLINTLSCWLDNIGRLKKHAM